MRFSRSSSSLQFQFVAFSMSSRPPYRGGRNQYRRGFCGTTSDDGTDHYVTGDSRCRGANRGSRPPSRGRFDRRPEPYNHRRPPQFDSHQPPPQLNSSPPRLDYRPPHFSAPSGQNPSFRPPDLVRNQQFRPRLKKPLDYRNWEYARAMPPPNCERFTVLSYNILADYLARDHRFKLYFHIPRHILDWEWRKKNIMFELGLWSADVLCFQEVDRFQDLEEELKVRGYCGIWKMRTGNPVDGCAIFWHHSRFKLLHEESIEFNKLGLRDNVAQICVLESIDQKRCKSAVSASTVDPHKVVICNIHVLYNPKRGEIKLAQVRVLLDRAHAVSRLWDAAPIVLCGDFNCTPQSPLYRFISGQRLDLSLLPRDKLSGQASCEIRAPKPVIPNLRSQTSNAPKIIDVKEGKQCDITDSSSYAPTRNDERKVDQIETPLNIQLQVEIDRNNGNVPSTRYLSEPHSVDSMLNTSSGLCINRQKNEEPTDHDEVCKDEISSNPHNTIPDLDGHQCRYSTDQLKDKMHERIDIYSDAISKKQGENIYGTNSAPQGSSSEHRQLNICDEAMDLHNPKGTRDSCSTVARIPCDSAGNVDKDLPSSELLQDTCLQNVHRSTPLGSPQRLSSISVTNEKNYFSASQDVDILLRSSSNDILLDEQIECVSGNKIIESPENETLDSLECTEASKYVAIPESRQLHPPSAEIPNDRSAWTSIELETAIGSSDCTYMENHLQLRSTYSEVEDFSGSRDSIGEPLVTSYNSCFLGTVDYIWRSEGLQTVRVLAPIPKQAMQWTNGFPTKKWGSDHIALVSEMAFTKDKS